jgi:hypothetical protein
MKQTRKYVRALRWLPFLLAAPMMAQSQIGGGTCSSATLNGSYSTSLTGRQLNSSVAFTNVAEAVGSVTFDGLSKAVLTLTSNTGSTTGTPQTLSGTYSLQANCVGVLTITSGDTATFTLEAYNSGKDYLITGEDGTYVYIGNGGVLPATCPAGLTAGNYPFSGSGFGLTLNAVSSAFEIIGLVQFSGTNTISVNASIVPGGTVKTLSATGTYTLSSGCAATASVTDGSGIVYTMVLEFTSASGGNFIFSSASSANIFTGSGRPL